MVTEKTISCVIDTKVEKTLLSFPHAEKVEIIDKYNIETGVTLTADGVSTEVKNLAEVFAGKDMPTFDPSAQWELPTELFGVRPAETRKRLASLSTPTRDGVGRSSVALSPDANLLERLRSRLPSSRRRLRRRGSSASGAGSARG